MSHSRLVMRSVSIGLLLYVDQTKCSISESQAEPSLQATQMKLKRARLADDLNEKIAQRPGPMELVEKNILPVDSSVKEAIIGILYAVYRSKMYSFVLK